MADRLTEEQQVQEDWYGFPYHYLGSLPPEFSVARVHDWHLNYASASFFLIEEIEKSAVRKSILDVGCGDGRFTRELAKCFPGSQVKGIDYSSKAIKLAQALNSDVPVEFQTCDLISDPIDSNNDVVVMMEVYEHIDPGHASAFLRGVSGLLRQGGELHLTVPHRNVPVSHHHFRHFNSTVLSDEIGRYFRVELVKPFERITYMRKWLNRLLINRFFVLNNRPLLNRAFDFYMKRMFHCALEEQCQRLYLRATKE